MQGISARLVVVACLFVSACTADTPYRTQFLKNEPCLMPAETTSTAMSGEAASAILQPTRGLRRRTMRVEKEFRQLASRLVTKDMWERGAIRTSTSTMIFLNTIHSPMRGRPLQIFLHRGGRAVLHSPSRNTDTLVQEVRSVIFTSTILIRIPGQQRQLKTKQLLKAWSICATIYKEYAIKK